MTYNGTAWASNNRVDGVNYDASGNLAGYRYDAASRITLAEGVCYLYDAEGRRVAKGTSFSDNVCENLTNIYVLGAGGEQLSEYDGSGNWKHTNVYGAGRLLATYDAAGTHFHLTDWLGTMRAQVSSNGVVDETCIDMPFGDDQNCSGPGVDATEHHFTGKVRDVETGFDYFGARYYASASGRWMSPDWSATAAPVPYAKLDYPQSLNLYAYVENNPLTMADADGHADAMGDPCLTPGCQQSTAADQEARTRDQQIADNETMQRVLTQHQYGRQADGSYKADPAKVKAAIAGGKAIGSGQCVDLCRFLSSAPRSDKWTAGRHAASLTDADIGTAIATFDSSGHYPSNKDPLGKNSAIFMGRGTNGSIWVVDQWPVGDGPSGTHQPFLHEIRNYAPDNNVHPLRSNNADAYYVVRVP